MKRGKYFGIFAMLLCAVLSLGQSGRAQAAQPDLSRLTGVWRGQMDGLPAVTLVVTDEGGSLSGAVLFYLHMRKMVNYPVTSTPGLPEPMFGMNFDGTALTFQVSHRRAHPPGTLSDPPVTFTLTLTGANQAEFVNRSDRSPALIMVRSDY